MEIDWSTMLIQKEDGQLYFRDGEEEVLASPTDICKHYRNMQYNLNISLGCHLTDRADLIDEVLREEIMWLNEYQEQPENCIRIK